MERKVLWELDKRKTYKGQKLGVLLSNVAGGLPYVIECQECLLIFYGCVVVPLGVYSTF